MQDKFVGNVGDFGKYGLLRALTSPPQPDGERELSLGIVWYMVGEDGTGATEKPGPTYRYLQKADAFRDCDQPLFDTLKQIVEGDRRKITSIHDSHIFPQDTVFCDARLTFDAMPTDDRIARRQEWARSAVAATVACDLVFVDPDNGLEVGTPRHHKHGLKYVFFDEVSPYIHGDQNLIIYQHMNHKKSVDTQIQERVLEIKGRLQIAVVIALRFRPGRTTFFIVPNKRDENVLSRRTEGFLARWRGHFERKA